MEKAVILHYMDQNYCFVNDKGEYVFRLRTKKDDAKKVILHGRDKYVHMLKSSDKKKMEMEKVATDGLVDYYEAALSLDMICFRYFLELVDKEGNSLYYGNYTFWEKKPKEIRQMFDCPLKSKEEDRFLVPKWAKGKVVYQIFPDRFAGGENEKLWYESPMKNWRAMYGGNLRGIIDKLAYLKDLGVDIIYMTPIFLSDSNHKYNTTDYYTIDPGFGTKEDLKELVDKAHSMGMYVMLDGVFNHTGMDFFAFRDLKEKGEMSKYKDWYYPKSFPLKGKFGEKPNYLSFGYFGGMPKLNTSNPEVLQYICDVVTYWMKECDIDGWRLDVGDEISHGFWKRFRQKVKEVKEDALIVGENWFYAPAYLQGDEWDSIMNYHFRDAVLGFIGDGTLTATEFAGRLGFMRGSIHQETYDVLWNLIDCHDTPRFMHVVKGSKKKQLLAATIQMLSHGCPMLYYGDEVGMTGGNDPDCRRGMLWKEELQDKAIYAYYKKVLSLRKSEPCITKGQSKILRTDDENGLVIEERKFTDNKTKRSVVLIYHNGNKTVSVPEYAGKYNLLADSVFDGKVKAYETVVLLMEGDRIG